MINHIFNRTKERLRVLGYAMEEKDYVHLKQSIQSMKNTIYNNCNIKYIPEGLLGIAVDMAAGEFLFLKKNTGQLKDFDLDNAIKQIKEGKTDITFAIGEGSLTPEQRLDAIFNYLLYGKKDELLRYRRLSW